jgi:hypothetical protein
MAGGAIMAKVKKAKSRPDPDMMVTRAPRCDKNMPI